jgi:ADP-heptose:LPS heptosyltransferase/uncharacterized coiled-coil protein SlyX
VRILISNPDTAGDVILRQPMFAALEAAGHELLLLVRSFIKPIIPLMGIHADAAGFEGDPLDPSFNLEGSGMAAIIEKALAFRPELFVAASFRFTQLEELLAPRLPGVVLAGLSGGLYPGDPNAGLRQISSLRFHQQAEVGESWPEVMKSERLCGLILRRNVKLPPPVLKPGPAQRRTAKQLLRELGIGTPSFWVACVGDNQAKRIKNWSHENWARVLSAMVERHGVPLLFVGTPDEDEATEAIRDMMNASGARTISICAEPAPLDTLVALIEYSSGYIGKDTGPMHMAASLAKPVVAVFGGGHWPRFVPSAATGAVLTTKVPCAGCEWLCHLPDSYCVKEVPVSPVMEAMDAVVSGRSNGFNVHELPARADLLEKMIAQSGRLSREIRRSNAALVRRLQEDLNARLAQADTDRTARLQAMESLSALLAESEADRSARLEAIKALEARLADAEAAYAARRKVIEELSIRLAESEDDRSARLKSVEELSAELKKSEADRAARLKIVEELTERLAESEADRAVRLKSVEDLTERLAESEADRAARLKIVEELSARLAEAEADRAARLKSVEDLTERLAESEADRAARLEHVRTLQAKLDELSAEMAARKAAVDSTFEQLAESEADRAALLHVMDELHSRLTAQTLHNQAAQRELASVCARLEEAETDRAARLRAIEELGIRLAESDADRAARLEVIEAQGKRIASIHDELQTALARLAALENSRVSWIIKLFGKSY